MAHQDSRGNFALVAETVGSKGGSRDRLIICLLQQYRSTFLLPSFKEQKMWGILLLNEWGGPSMGQPLLGHE